jgi:hypothetical protein
MAVATLAIGMTFISGAFLTGMYFATLSTERTIGAVAAEEAFAKMRIFGLDVADPNLKTTGFVPYKDLATLAADESFYPSTRADTGRQYSWSAICRRVADVNDVNSVEASAGNRDLVQCVVLVSRETGSNSSYYQRKSGSAWPALEQTDLPCPLRVNIAQSSTGAASEEIFVKDAVASDTIDERTFVGEGSILVDDATGQIYRVLERDKVQPERIRLDRKWEGGDLTGANGGWVWTVPPAVTGGRIPGVAAYEKIVRFPRP